MPKKLPLTTFTRGFIVTIIATHDAFNAQINTNHTCYSIGISGTVSYHCGNIPFLDGIIGVGDVYADHWHYYLCCIRFLFGVASI